MKLFWSTVLLASLAISPAIAQDTTSEKGKLSYAIGYKIGSDFVEGKMDVDINTVIQALRDGHAKRAPTVSEAAMMDALGKMQERMMSEAKAEYDRMAATNRAASSKFLADNKSKRGVQTLPSGLQYRVIEDGDGKAITANSEVTLHYRGSLVDGREFDSSFARGEPITIKVNEVIKGWQEALPRMRGGANWQLFIPASLAYGERGSPPRVGPEQALVFDLKIVDVK